MPEPTAADRAPTPPTEGQRIRAAVERHFRVYEARDERLHGETLAQLFYVMFPATEFEPRFDAVRKAIGEIDRDLLVFLRRDGGEDILFVARRPPPPPRRVGLSWTLLALTLATTVWAGALFWQGYNDASGSATLADTFLPHNLLWGALTFAVPLMLVIGLHELAHSIAARRHGLRATLPFFIPVPPVLGMPIGTLGAFISLRDPLPDRKALFDVGASGPLAGFFVAIPLVVAGMWLTDSTAMPVPDLDRPDVVAMGDVDAGSPGRTTIDLTGATEGYTTFTVTAPDNPRADRYEVKGKAILTVDGKERTDTFRSRLDPGETQMRSLRIPANTTAATVRLEWDDHLWGFGDPLLIHGARWVLPWDGEDVLTHPTFFAGWVGLLVTGINLLPVSQLDGGHVARALLGDRMRWAAYASVGLLMVLAIALQSWLLMALFVLFMGVHHPPPLNDRTPLDRRRIAIGILVLLVFIVTLVPQPLKP